MRLSATTMTLARVRLEPVDQTHRDGLRAAAADPALWRWWPRPGLDRAFDAGATWLDGEVNAGRMIAFTVFMDERIVGQSCYLAIRPDHAGVEIGHTWYAGDVHATNVNPAAKHMLLSHAFACGAERVELKTDAANARSRGAILKLGAQFEGIFRHHLRRPDGSWRDTAWYSILSTEWPAVKAGLEARLAVLGYSDSVITKA